ncbi:hypothetical protein AA313_de0202751 [Arthrobotrys entomopaga]|nr:hypothetical protein AA313_de0202751 [Arthrobotrys entomopaga]
MERLPIELLDGIACRLSSADLKSLAPVSSRYRDVCYRYLHTTLQFTYSAPTGEIELRCDLRKYEFYVRNAVHVRKLRLTIGGTTSLDDLTGQELMKQSLVHKNSVTKLLEPFERLESLDVTEYRMNAPWFFDLVKTQLESKHMLKELSLTPNILNLCRGHIDTSENDDVDMGIPLRDTAVARIKRLKLTFRANEYDAINSKRAAKCIEIVAGFARSTETVETLVFDGILPWYPRPTRRLSLPHLTTFLIHTLVYSEPPVPNIVYGLIEPETLSNVRVHSVLRHEPWGNASELLEQFERFPNLEELHIYHSYDLMDCTACGNTHKILHVEVLPAWGDTRILTQHLNKLRVLKWYSSDWQVLLFQYHIARDPGQAPKLRLERSKFETIERKGLEACFDYHGTHEVLDVIGENISPNLKDPLDFTSLPPRINWMDLHLFKRGSLGYGVLI